LETRLVGAAMANAAKDTTMAEEKRILRVYLKRLEELEG